MDDELEQDRLARWAATQPRDNYVYQLTCGHEVDFPVDLGRLPLDAKVVYDCAVHGEQTVYAGRLADLPRADVSRETKEN